MKHLFAAGSFAFFFVLLLACSPLRAAEPDPAPPETPNVSADAAAPDATADAATGAGEDSGEPPPEKFTVAGVDDAVSRFQEKTAEEQTDMMNRALEGVNKLTPEEQRQLAAVQKERADAMSPQQAEQEARDELSSMSPEQQDSMRSQWEKQLQNDPDYRKLDAEDRNKVIQQVRNFGKDIVPDIVTPPGT